MVGWDNLGPPTADRDLTPVTFLDLSLAPSPHPQQLLGSLVSTRLTCKHDMNSPTSRPG